MAFCYSRRARLWKICLPLALLTLPVIASSDPATTEIAGNVNQLLKRLQQADYKTPHGAPLLIESSLRDSRSEAHAYTIIDHPLAAIESQTRTPAQWCEILVLHSHIKGCIYQQKNQSQIAMDLFFGDKTYQELGDAEAVTFSYQLDFDPDKKLLMQLRAPHGPMGSYDLSLSVEFVALDEQRSVVHITYVTHHGSMAQLMLSTYLSTLGRNKVGFSTLESSDIAREEKIKGVRGIVERNVARYLLAIFSKLDSTGESHQQRFISSAENWHRYSLLYIEQLKELNLTVYLKGKIQEHANQLQRQQEIDQLNSTHSN